MSQPESIAGSLSVEWIDGHGRVGCVLAGEMDASNCIPAVDRLLTAWSDSRDVAELELDMTAVSRLDGTALRALVLLAEELEGAGGRLRIIQASLPVRWVLHLAGAGERLGVAW